MSETSCLYSVDGIQYNPYIDSFMIDLSLNFPDLPNINVINISTVQIQAVEQLVPSKGGPQRSVNQFLQVFFEICMLCFNSLSVLPQALKETSQASCSGR
jgi:hypothetical protein